MDLTGSTATIPCISVMMEDGEYLIRQLEKDPEMTISFPKDLTPLPSQFAGQMSDFSSWGVAPDLSLEPDITAPGGNVVSIITVALIFSTYIPKLFGAGNGQMWAFCVALYVIGYVFMTVCKKKNG